MPELNLETNVLTSNTAQMIAQRYFRKAGLNISAVVLAAPELVDEADSRNALNATLRQLH